MSRTRIDFFVKRWIRSLGDLSGKVVVDLPAGMGIMSRALREQGALVEAYDLNPDLFRVDDIECRRADLSRELPIPTAHADLVLCEEGIEHVPNQLGMLRELNRILRRGGRLVVTTPNVSSLRARFSHFLVESDLWSRMPPTELDSVWLAPGGSREMYYGHLFLIGAQKLRVLARLAGFRIVRLHGGKSSGTSLLLGLFLPLLLAANFLAYRRSLRRTPEALRQRARQVYREIISLNLHPKVLFGKKLFVELEKEHELGDVAAIVGDRRETLFEHLERQELLDRTEG